MSTDNVPISQKASVKGAIYSITPFTLLDYPNKTACILWLAGCNMRCLYCYNPEIVFGKGKITFDHALQFLQTRIGLLDGVVLSGGECLLHNDILAFASKLKALGFLIKVDTNGSRPNALRQMLRLGLVDYVALDFKALPEDFKNVTDSALFAHFKESLSELVQAKILFEVRTTFHSQLLDQNKLEAMLHWLEQMGYCGKYFIQHFKNGVDTIGGLGHSTLQLDEALFKSPTIEVVFR